MVFAGDHGVCAAGTTRVPPADTVRQIAAALRDAGLTVIDVGVARALEPRPGLVVRKVRAGTRDFTAEPALTRDEAHTAVEIGIGAADNALDEGAGTLIGRGIGVGGTAPALALIAALTLRPGDALSSGDALSTATRTPGRPDPEVNVTPLAACGAGPDGARMLAAVRQGLIRHRPDPRDPLGVLAAVGGLEHAALAGFILAAAAHGVPVAIEGEVGESAAAVAAALAPASATAVVR